MRWPNRIWRVAVVASALAIAGGILAPAGAAPDQAGPPPIEVVPKASPDDWSPVTDDIWAYEDGQVILTEPGTNQGGPRRPFEYNVVDRGPELTDITYSAEVRIDEAVEVTNRDVILVWNYQSPTRFYYAHLSTDNKIYPHNGIFVVNDADRLRIDDQWDADASVGAPPAITDANWHDVRLDYDADSGSIEVYVDEFDEPLMTATDTAFSGGRVGFGSFDNFGRVRDVSVTGERLRD